jgi:hypothetical protein
MKHGAVQKLHFGRPLTALNGSLMPLAEEKLISPSRLKEVVQKNFFLDNLLNRLQITFGKSQELIAFDMAGGWLKVLLLTIPLLLTY